MPKLDMGAAWDDAAALLRSHTGLTGAIAALFLFLPALVVFWLGPPAYEPAPGAAPNELWAGMMTYFNAALPWLFVQSLLAMFAGIAILRLWLARSGTSVGEALSFAASFFLTIFLLQILLSLILLTGFLLLLLPGLYLLGRFSLTSPYVAHREMRGPFTVLGASWRATAGNGWRITLFLALIFVAFLVISGLVGMLTTILAGLGGVGNLLAGAISAMLSTVMGLVSAAVSAAIYRQLAGDGPAATFI